MSNKVIIVVTNHDQLGETGQKTGWFLPEVAHPYQVFIDAGKQVTFVSPKGGKAPMDPGSYDQFKDDLICKDFLANKEAKKALENTKPVKEISASNALYGALFYAGGHGPMWDIPESTDMANLASSIYGKGGILSAVCHGTVGFVTVKKPDGTPLVKGENVTCFTDSEERACKLEKVVPFLLETRLREQGAKFTSGPDFSCHVAIGNRLVTGQNPASASKTAEEIVKLMKK